MTATVAGIHLGIDTHANRPAGNAVPDGSLYSCSTHSLVYKSNFAGNSWATWATLTTSAGTTITFCRKTTNESFSSTSYANSTNMSFSVAANTNYKYRYIVYYNTNATSVGIKLALNGPASTTCYAGVTAAIGAPDATNGHAQFNGVAASGDISTDLAVLTPTIGPGAGNVMAIIEGFMATSSTSGTFTLRHASETATATTILANSHGELIVIP